MNIQKKRKTTVPISHRIAVVAAIIGLSALMFPGFVIGQSYVEPFGPPPQSVPSGRPALEFLNGSIAKQQKLGSFLIGQRLPGTMCTTSDTSGCSKLCLNADLDLWTNDSSTCIAEWADLAVLAGGSYLRRLDGSELAQLDVGFSNVQGDFSRFQLLSLIAEADSTVANNATGIESRSTSTSHYAAQFFGTLRVQPESGASPLCLNGDCITSWSDLSGGPIGDALSLQTTQTTSSQPGNIGLNGPLLVGSIVSGVPTAAYPVSYTCGDGLCSPENESSLNCPADCL